MSPRRACSCQVAACLVHAGMLPPRGGTVSGVRGVSSWSPARIQTWRSLRNGAGPKVVQPQSTAVFGTELTISGKKNFCGNFTRVQWKRELVSTEPKESLIRIGFLFPPACSTGWVREHKERASSLHASIKLTQVVGEEPSSGQQQVSRIGSSQAWPSGAAPKPCEV